MAKRGAHLKRTIKILDPDLEEIIGSSSIKSTEVMGAFRDYLDDEELFAHNRNHFHPDDLIKACLKEIGIAPKKVMSRGTLLKLFSGDARDAGLIDY